jgi:hypothetical protein
MACVLVAPVGGGVLSPDADAVDDDRDRRGERGQVLARVVLVGHQRRWLPGRAGRLAEEAVPLSGRGPERGGWFKPVFGRQRDLAGSIMLPPTDQLALAARRLWGFGR